MENVLKNAQTEGTSVTEHVVMRDMSALTENALAKNSTAYLKDITAVHPVPVHPATHAKTYQ